MSNDIDEYIALHLICGNFRPYCDLFFDDPEEFVDFVTTTNYYIDQIIWWEHIKIGGSGRLGGGGYVDPKNNGYYYSETYLISHPSKSDKTSDIISYLRDTSERYAEYGIIPSFSLSKKK